MPTHHHLNLELILAGTTSTVLNYISFITRGSGHRAKGL